MSTTPHRLRGQRPEAAVSRSRVVIVDRHRLVADAIARTLVGRFHAVPAPLPHLCPTAEAVSAALRTRAPVAVLRLPADGVLEPLFLVAELIEHGVGVVVAGRPHAPESLDDYAAVGATCLQATHPQIADLVRAIDDEMSRLSDPDPSPRVPRPPHDATAGWEARRPRACLGRLTAAEARILWALMQGHGAEDIAREKVVSVATVRTQIAHVLRKLEVRSQLSAVALAWEAGWDMEGAAVA